jgi:hypothetical protein
VYGDENLVEPRFVIVEGCLTASDDRFVLTELEGGVPGPRVAQRSGERPWAEPEPTTEAYRLVGMEDDLRRLVGRRVAVTGEAEPEKVVDLRRSSPPVRQDPLPEVGTSGLDPKISTVGTARIEISDLQVRSAVSTGDSCPEPPR